MITGWLPSQDQARRWLAQKRTTTPLLLRKRAHPTNPPPAPRGNSCYRGFQLLESCTRQFYFCVSTDTSLRQMPALKPEYEVLAKAVTGRLRGDPSLPLDEEPEEEPPAADDEEEVPTKKLQDTCTQCWTLFRPSLRFFDLRNKVLLTTPACILFGIWPFPPLYVLFHSSESCMVGVPSRRRAVIFVLLVAASSGKRSCPLREREKPVIKCSSSEGTMCIILEAPRLRGGNPFDAVSECMILPTSVPAGPSRGPCV